MFCMHMALPCLYANMSMLHICYNMVSMMYRVPVYKCIKAWEPQLSTLEPNFDENVKKVVLVTLYYQGRTLRFIDIIV